MAPSPRMRCEHHPRCWRSPAGLSSSLWDRWGKSSRRLVSICMSAHFPSGPIAALYLVKLMFPKSERALSRTLGCVLVGVWEGSGSSPLPRGAAPPPPRPHPCPPLEGKQRWTRGAGREILTTGCKLHPLRIFQLKTQRL